MWQVANGKSRTRAAFTLIEVLLVLVILGVMVTVMLPQVMGSLREHELRGATRTVIAAGRHAMSLAVLSQRRMNVVYDLDAATLTVRAADAREFAPTNAVDTAESIMHDATQDPWGPEPSGAEPARDGAYQGAVAIVDEEVVHRMDSLRFSYIEIEGDDGYRAEEGKHTIIYYTNGRGTPHTIGLEDNEGATASIQVDALCSAHVLRE